MNDNNQILSDLIEAIKTDVINSMQAKGRNATGETIAALESVLTPDNGQLLASWWIDALEVGRKPTSQGAIQGEPPMIDNIKAWCEAKGIDVSLAWAIKKSIDKNGYPGTPGVLTEPLSDDNVNMRLDEATSKMADEQGQSIIGIFDELI